MAPVEAPPFRLVRTNSSWFAPIVYSLLGSVAMVTTLWGTSDMTADMLMSSFRSEADNFDFIVVGAGSAGSVVANRLSRSYNVLLLEAGGEPNPLVYMPVSCFMLLNYPEHDWMYKTIPQKSSCQSLIEKRSAWSAGKSLGGTSNLYFLLHLRGHTLDYNYIANLTGDSSWNYDGVLPHFKNTETYYGITDQEDVHGTNGELPLELPTYLRPLADTFVKAGLEQGYPYADLNGRYNTGFSHAYFPLRRGRRVSSYNAFIQPIRNRSSLTIRKWSQVTKVLLEDNKNEAYGVEYIRHGKTKRAFASKEVILSAGTVGSPRILMLSGIGIKRDLERVGIKSRADLPVGQNIQDHISVYLGPFFVNQSVSMLLDRDINPLTFLQFVGNGEGPFSSSGCIATALLTTEKAKKAGEGNWPDIHFILQGFGAHETLETDFAQAFNVRSDVLEKYFAGAKGKDSFHIVVSLARPKAKGYMTLSGPSHRDELLIDAKYLDNQHDIDTLVEGIKMAMNLVENSTAFSAIGAEFIKTPFPGCENVVYRSDEYWECFARQYTMTLHHMVGSASMGSPTSKDAVVDSKLNVINTKRLRVMDLSVLPKVPVSNTHAPATMIGDKGASIVLDMWNSNNELENEINKLV